MFRTTLTSLCLITLALLPQGAAAERFCVVALPDTQNYSEFHPEVFTAQTSWIKSNVAALNIAFVTHLGDIVNEGWKDGQWANARNSMDLLRGRVPFGLCPGNHDLLSAPGEWNSTKFVANFGPAYFSGYSWYGGASPRGFSSYQIVNAGGFTLLFLHLECAPPGSEIDWAISVLESHPGVPAILTTHEYLVTDKRDRTAAVGGADRHSGEEMWNDLVRRYDQIVAVLCGHISSPYNYHRQISINNAGRNVYEMLSDYQNLPSGGNGWLRILTFDTTAGSIGVRTFSPFLNSYKTDAGNQFEYELDLGARLSPASSIRLVKPAVQSAFASGPEGWGVVGDGTSTLEWKSDADGKGYLYCTETAGGTRDWFAAPAIFRGDLSQYDGIAFDYRVFTPEANPDAPVLRLYSGSDYYEWANTERVVRNGQWERLVASLRDDDLWKSGGTAEPFSSFITHVSGVRVSADLDGVGELNGLDNFALVVSEDVRRVAVASRFDSGLDRWAVNAPVDVSFDSHGSMSAASESGGSSWEFCAPVGFRGNRSACVGGMLAFDLKQAKANNQITGAGVTLEGNGLTLTHNWPPTENPDTSWRSYAIALDQTAGWINQSTGTAATAADISSALGSLSSLRIGGTYRSGAAQTWLDNVILTEASPVRVEIGPSSAPVTRSGPVSFRVTYSGVSAITLQASDVTLNTTGSASASTVTVLGGTGYRTVLLTGITGDGALGISIRPGTAAADDPVPGAGPSDVVVVDNTPPGPVAVTDEGRLTPSTSTLLASWTPASDGGGSGIGRYWYTVGTYPGAIDSRAWTAVGQATSVAASPLALSAGATYFLSVMAVDVAGNMGPSRSTDGILVAPLVERIGLAWAVEDAVPLSLTGKSVTATAPGSFWIEEPDRSAALKVVSGAGVEAGDVVDVAGELGKPAAQRVLFGDVCIVKNSGDPLSPVGLSLRDLGGASWNALTTGVAGARGLYNAGLLVRCWGKVYAANQADPVNRYFTLGSGVAPDRAIRVRCGHAAFPPVGSFAVVTGVVEIEFIDGIAEPVLMLRGPSDLITVP